MLQSRKACAAEAPAQKCFLFCLWACSSGGSSSTVIRVGATASRDAQGTHPLGRWLVNHAMKASKFIGSVNVKVSSDEC